MEDKLKIKMHNCKTRVNYYLHLPDKTFLYIISNKSGPREVTYILALFRDTLRLYYNTIRMQKLCIEVNFIYEAIKRALNYMNSSCIFNAFITHFHMFIYLIDSMGIVNILFKTDINVDKLDMTGYQPENQIID